MRENDFYDLLKEIKVKKREEYEIDNLIFEMFYKMTFDCFNLQLNNLRGIRNKEVPNINELL